VFGPARDAADTQPELEPMRGPIAPGLEGLVQREARGTDLAENLLTLGRAVGMVEEAAIRAVSGLLPSGVHTVGVRCELELAHPTAVPLGATLTASARVLEVRARERLLLFEVAVRHGERRLAGGRLTRAMVDVQKRQVRSAGAPGAR
jgi:predicted thioesterase